MVVARDRGSRPPQAAVGHQHEPNHPHIGGGTTGAPHEPNTAHVGTSTALRVSNSQGALNPPFDPRMRKVGSPLNQTKMIKRGWIQSEDATQRVNFLFNPSQLDLSHQVDADHTKSPLQDVPNDVMDPFYTATGSSLSVSLLYDRTYELFSSPKEGADGLANTYGVYADVAAWYTFLKMLDAMPTSWVESMPVQPMNLIPSYLFVGPRMIHYGFVSSINVTYSHWTQNMIPQRGKVDVGFSILPRVRSAADDGYFADLSGSASAGANATGGWAQSGTVDSPVANNYD